MKITSPKKIKKFLNWLERFIDKAVPYLAILLALIIIAEFTIKGIEHYEIYLIIIDYFILSFFILDLIFKWFRVRKLKKFIKLYWLDLIAVFPFYLIIRAYLRITALIRVGEEVAQLQQFAHETVLIREAKLAESLEKEAKVLKEMRPLTRLLRLFQRIIRATKARLALTLKSVLHIHAKHRKKDKK